MHMYKVGLSCQDTILASDHIWMKPPCVPASGLPTPIPLPRNKPGPSISTLSYITPIEDDIDGITPRSTPCSLQQTLQPADLEVDIQIMLDVSTSVTPEFKLGLQVSIFCSFSLYIPTYVLCSWLDCLVRIPFSLAILLG